MVRVRQISYFQQHCRLEWWSRDLLFYDVSSDRLEHLKYTDCTNRTEYLWTLSCGTQSVDANYDFSKRAGSMMFRNNDTRTSAVVWLAFQLSLSSGPRSWSPEYRLGMLINSHSSCLCMVRFVTVLKQSTIKHNYVLFSSVRLNSLHITLL